MSFTGMTSRRNEDGAILDESMKSKVVHKDEMRKTNQMIKAVKWVLETGLITILGKH